LFHDAALPPNVLAHLPEDDVAAIFAPKSGQARVDELFRRVQHTSIDAATVSTVAMQQDSGRRARGARERLRKEGVLVLDATGSNPDLALKLDLPVPGRGEWVSARITPLAGNDKEAPFLEIDGQRWTLANTGDPVVEVPPLGRQA
jgi:hypothetical protein